MPTVSLAFSLVVLMLFISSLYIAAEFTAASAHWSQIRQMAGQDNRLAQWLLSAIKGSKTLDTYVTACRVAVIFSSLVAGDHGRAISLIILLISAIIVILLVLLNSFSVMAKYAIISVRSAQQGIREKRGAA